MLLLVVSLNISRPPFKTPKQVFFNATNIYLYFFCDVKKHFTAAEITFTLPNLAGKEDRGITIYGGNYDGNYYNVKKIQKMPKYCVEMRDQTGTEWIQVKQSRPEDGPLDEMSCISTLGVTIKCKGFKIGGLVHSTRIEFRVSVLSELHAWTRLQNDGDGNENTFPVPWNSRTGRLSNVIRVFTSGPSKPGK